MLFHQSLASDLTATLSFPAARLFFPGDSAQSIGQLFVNFSPVTDREDPDDPRFAIQSK